MCVALWSRPGEYGLNVREILLLCVYTPARQLGVLIPNGGKKKKTGVRHLESLERFPLPHSLMAEAPVRGAQSQRGGRQIKAGITVEVGER